MVAEKLTLFGLRASRLLHVVSMVSRQLWESFYSVYGTYIYAPISAMTTALPAGKAFLSAW